MVRFRCGVELSTVLINGEVDCMIALLRFGGRLRAIAAVVDKRQIKCAACIRGILACCFPNIGSDYCVRSFAILYRHCSICPAIAIRVYRLSGRKPDVGDTRFRRVTTPSEKRRYPSYVSRCIGVNGNW